MCVRALGVAVGTLVLATCYAQGPSVKRSEFQPGMYKAPIADNHAAPEGGDGKFKFLADGTFEYSRKTTAVNPITHGTYTVGGNTVELEPNGKDANWPATWPQTVTLKIKESGDLEMNGLVFTSNLIGKAFEPGRYDCGKTPNIHYYFDRNGGYKYTGLGVSTGDYWVQKETDPVTGESKVYVVLSILRIDGKLTRFHQKVELDPDGSFTMLGKYKYTRATTVAAKTK